MAARLQRREAAFPHRLADARRLCRARRLAAAGDAERRILDALCRLATEVLACDATHTYLWDAEREEYSAAAGYGDTPEQWEAWGEMAEWPILTRLKR